MPVRGRVELRAELVGGKRVRRGFETGLLVGKGCVRRFFVEPASALLEFRRRREAVPHRRIGRQNMRERNESCARERVVPNTPEPRCRPFRLSACDFRQRDSAGKGDTGQREHTTTVHEFSWKERGRQRVCFPLCRHLAAKESLQAGKVPQASRECAMVARIPCQAAFIA